MFATSDFPSENPRIQTRNYSYTNTLAIIKPKKNGKTKNIFKFNIL